MGNRWTLQDARAHFSKLVAAAKAEPQFVTKWGDDAVVVMSSADYRRLAGGDDAKKVLEEMPDVDLDLEGMRAGSFRHVDL